MKGIKCSEKYNGFTLIEVMIVVAIIAIIAALAAPAYQNHVRKAERAAAQAKMLEIAGMLESNFLQRGQYVDTFVAAVNADSGLNVSPNASKPRYNIVVTTPDGNNQSFTITATPTGPQAEDRCGKIAVNSSNQKTASKGGTAVSDCW